MSTGAGWESKDIKKSYSHPALPQPWLSVQSVKKYQRVSWGCIKLFKASNFLVLGKAAYDFFSFLRKELRRASKVHVDTSDYACVNGTSYGFICLDKSSWGFTRIHQAP